MLARAARRSLRRVTRLAASAPRARLAAPLPVRALASAAAPADAGGSHDDFAPVRKAKPGSAAETIKADVEGHKVFLYMKGHPSAPQCGFSAHVAKILQVMGVEFSSRNVLEDMEVREGVKVYSGWPTLPQLFVGGEFVGGADIVNEMYHSGELRTALEEADALPKQ